MAASGRRAFTTRAYRGAKPRLRFRDQAHAAAGLTCLRFTHEQIAFEAAYVEGILVAVRERLCS
jgi:hypothetical protein